MSHHLPTYWEMVKVPELALLTVLEFTLDASVSALVAAHPRLDPRALPHHVRTKAWCAERLLGHIRNLKLLLEWYRQLAEDSLHAEEGIRG